MVTVPTALPHRSEVFDCRYTSARAVPVPSHGSPDSDLTDVAILRLNLPHAGRGGDLQRAERGGLRGEGGGAVKKVVKGVLKVVVVEEEERVMEVEVEIEVEMIVMEIEVEKTESEG